MANFRSWVEVTRAGNFLVRHHDGSRLPNKKLKKFTDYCIEKMQSMDIDGEKKTGHWLANALADRVMERYYKGEIHVVDSSESLDDLAELYLENNKGLSWCTQDLYARTLRFLIKEMPTIQQLSSENMKQWRGKMEKEGLKNNTVKAYLSGASWFCNWLIKEKKMSPWKFDEGIIPAMTESKPKYYSTEEFLALEREVSKLDPRAVIACRLAHDYGLRMVETVGDGCFRMEGVLWEDLIWREDGKVDLMICKSVTKGQRTGRTIRVTQSFINLLGSRRSGPLAPIARRRLEKIFIEASKNAGINPKLTFHGLRHSFGKNFMQRSGGNLAALQILLGHRNITTTQIYAQFEKTYLGDCVETMHEDQKVREALAGQMQDRNLKIIVSPRTPTRFSETGRNHALSTANQSK